MISLKAVVGGLVVSALMFGCSSSHTAEKSSQSTIMKASSTSSIITDKETEYARLYQLFKNKSGAQDAKDSASAGVRSIKVIYAGRGNTVIPAFDSAPKNCKLVAIDGMGDVLYGENHLKYRKLMRAYAEAFNTEMKQHCN